MKNISGIYSCIALWSHFSGAFALAALGALLLPAWAAAAAVLLGGVLLEAHQWRCEPWYAGKRLDTVLDLACNTAGVVSALGVIV